MNKLVSLVKNLVKHDLISGSFYVFIGTTLANFLAFVLNIYFARRLSYSDYGILAALLSLSTLAVIPANSMGTIVTRFATQFISLNEQDKASVFYKRFFKYLILGSVIAVLFSFILANPFSKFLKISDPFLITFLAITVCANYLLVLNLSFLNSLLKLKFISFTYVVSGIVKIIAGIIFVFLGFRVYGGLGAVLALVIVQFLVSLYPLKNLIFSKSGKVKLPVMEFVKFAVPAFIAIFSLFSFVSMDVILVKHFFAARDAGFYGALALVGKVIFYFTLPIPFVMFPLIVKKHAAKEAYNKLFYLALFIVAVPGIFITLFYFIFPKFTIDLFLGGREYLTIVPFLGLYGIFLTIYSLNYTFVNYYLSIKKTKVALLVFIFALAQIILINFYHTSFYEVIYSSIATSILLLLSLILLFLITSRSKKT